MGEDVVVAQSKKNSAGIDETDKTSTIISTTFVNIEKQFKDNCHGSARQPQIVNKIQTMEKPKKWYNFTRQHSSNANNINSRSKNATDENSTNNRHSWHLNDSLEM
jgi:hypothetical protein